MNILTIKEVSSNFWTVQRILKIQKAKLVRISPGVRRTEREDQVTHGDLGHGVRFHVLGRIYSKCLFFVLL